MKKSDFMFLGIFLVVVFGAATIIQKTVNEPKTKQ